MRSEKQKWGRESTSPNPPELPQVVDPARCGIFARPRPKRPICHGTRRRRHCIAFPRFATTSLAFGINNHTTISHIFALVAQLLKPIAIHNNVNKTNSTSIKTPSSLICRHRIPPHHSPPVPLTLAATTHLYQHQTYNPLQQ